ncbi:MAG TPA: DapH/DapD/GlmU-related protein [Ktedonobacterales bacterium]|nr:DapH/DapD/GlmU-related protein [Ktedonobacterales bacterium]
MGAWTRVTGKIFVQNGGRIRIGERVQLLSHYAHSVFATFPGGLLEIGDRTVLNYGVDICATKLVRIGADCLIGTHVIILDSDFHEVADHSRLPESRPVLIGNRVWIGNRATILPGVTIGDDAVVGAGSVVMSDVPARTLAMGNPARVIKKF